MKLWAFLSRTIPAKAIPALVFTLLTTGCVSMYVPMEGDDPHGYSQEQVGPDQYRIIYRTYRAAELRQTEAFVRYRAAELAKEKGFPYFRLDELKSDVKENFVTVQERHVGDGSSTGSHGSFNGPIVVPGYTRDMHIKRSEALVTLQETKADGTLSTDSVLANDGY